MRNNLLYMIVLGVLMLFLSLSGAAAQDSTATDGPQDQTATLSPSAGSSLSSVDAAAEAYRAGDFKKSIEMYEQIVAEALNDQRESAAVYYNLGNAYFRDNQLAKAILNYERAYLLNPGNGDIRHNLRFAQNRTEDKIEKAGVFFLQSWFRSVRDLNSSNRWAVVSIIFFLIFLICLGVFFFVRILWARKAAFYSGFFFLLLMIATTSFAFSQKRELTHRDGAIVMVGAASVNASPDRNSNRLFELHEGTKVKIRNTDGNWFEVQIENGSIGWTEKENLEVI